MSQESPTPKRPTSYDFSHALQLVLAGMKMGRLSWPKDEYIFMRDEYLMIHIKGADHNFTVRDPDMRGTDYIVIK